MPIDVYVGMPGEGKTYSMTALAIKLLKKGEKVYTNWPVITPDNKYSTLQWKKEYALENIVNSYILIDEAWKDYNSNTWKEMTKEEHQFFAEHRHVGNYVILATQSTARIATLVKELGEIVKIKKRRLLYLWNIGFDLYYYESLDAFNGRFFAKGEKPYYKREFIWFKNYIAQSYNTHQSEKHFQKVFEGKPWIVIENKKTISISNLNKSIVALKNFIASKDTKIDRGVNYCLKSIEKKYWRVLKWLWITFKPLRPCLNRIATLSLKMQKIYLKSRFHVWMVS